MLDYFLERFQFVKGFNFFLELKIYTNPSDFLSSFIKAILCYLLYWTSSLLLVPFIKICHAFLKVITQIIAFISSRTSPIKQLPGFHLSQLERTFSQISLSSFSLRIFKNDITNLIFRSG
ncbi:hypothetical protein CW304_02650 [Bacillus sp. UFRGS-B20]|nr:hypothetical protein CW304_02650 [Bacillus sp. UFRGS-B20]